VKFDPLEPLELTEEEVAELEALRARPSPLEGVTLERVRDELEKGKP
jgi:hypothetical protein